MTFTKAVTANLIENGLSEEDAQAVMYMIYNEDETMEGRWNNDIEGYSSVVLKTTLMLAHAYVVRWMDLFKPEHWARPMFAHDSTEASQ